MRLLSMLLSCVSAIWKLVRATTRSRCAAATWAWAVTRSSPAPTPGLVAAVVVVVEVLGRRQRFLRYLHRLPEAGQIPVGILDLRQRSGYLQPEDLLRGLQVVLGHVDESHIGDEAAPVEQRLVEAGSEPRNERRIEPQMLLRRELPDDAHARKVARPLGQKLGIAGAPGQRVGHHRRHARHHGRVQRRDVAVEAEIETQRGVERPHLPDLQRASAPRDAARRAHAASSRGGVHAGPENARVQPAGKRCARDAARRLSGLRAQQVRLSDRTQVALHLDIEIVLQRQRQGVRQRNLQLAVVNQVLQPRRVLQGRRPEARRFVGADRIWEPARTVREIAGEDPAPRDRLRE